MRKVKVLMVGNSSSVKGGITSVIGQLLEHDWETDGVEMRFIPTYIETNNLVKVVYFIIAYIRIFISLLRYKPDVIHIHMSYKGSFQRKYFIHKLCKKFNVRIVIHLHGSEFEKWFHESKSDAQRKIRALLRECDSFIVLGNKWNEAIKKIEPMTKTIVVSNAVHIPEETAEWNDKRFQVLFLGVLIERKGVSDLLHAVKQIVRSGKINNLKFVVAGSGTEEDKLKALCSNLKLDQYVTFVGWTDGKKKEKLLQESQMLVLPSYNEGLPIAILEAMSYGLPVVASDVGDISAAVKDEINGFLINPGDYERLAERIMCISSKVRTFEEMSKESRRHAVDNFADIKYFDKIMNTYLEQ